MNMIKAEKQLKYLESAYGRDWIMERLKGVEGGGAADCSAGREAGKVQADAEEAKPGSAALIPAVQARDALEWAVKVAENEAAYDDSLKSKHSNIGNVEQAAKHDMGAARFRSYAKYLVALIPSRKAKAAETLEHKTTIFCGTCSRDITNL